MNKDKVLILGGYGNFGKRIAEALVKSKIAIIISGRNEQKAQELAKNLNAKYPHSAIETAIFDVNSGLENYLKTHQILVVINTCGPFQNSDYYVAQKCIAAQVNYIDLSDGRDFVGEIGALDLAAKEKNILVVSGASSVPGLSSAVIEHYKNEFSAIDFLKFGISPGARAERGLATTKAILSYLGKPLKPISGQKNKNYGWQNIYRQEYPKLGKRWMANCDIPDLDLFPKIYNIKNIQFSAGMESGFLHIGIWLVSWLVRLGLPIKLENHAKFLLKISHYFDFLGSDDGAMHMIFKGRDQSGRPMEIKWFLIAKSGDGPQIPCVPAIILAKKLIAGTLKSKGALPCVGMITLAEYMEELSEFDIKPYQF
jgi:saccharopine dehydrogenase-like NADP-dependent oxidoreductase